MAVLVGMRGQQVHDNTYDASGTITSGGTAQLVLARSIQRSMLLIQNISDTNMFVGLGGALATAAITAGVVTSFSVTNAGFGYTIAPTVMCLGGGRGGNGAYLSAAQPGYPSPSSAAKGTVVLSGGAVSSITVDNGGSGYATAPYVYLGSSNNDNSGAFLPSATAGILLVSNGGSLFFNGTSCPTDAVSIFCASSSKAFTCRWMP